MLLNAVLLVFDRIWLRSPHDATVHQRSRPHIEDANIPRPACDIADIQSAGSATLPYWSVSIAWTTLIKVKGERDAHQFESSQATDHVEVSELENHEGIEERSFRDGRDCKVIPEPS